MSREFLNIPTDRRLRLSARGCHRVLRIARTLADMERAEGVRRVVAGV